MHANTYKSVIFITLLLIIMWFSICDGEAFLFSSRQGQLHADRSDELLGILRSIQKSRNRIWLRDFHCCWLRGFMIFISSSPYTVFWRTRCRSTGFHRSRSKCRLEDLNNSCFLHNIHCHSTYAFSICSRQHFFPPGAVNTYYHSLFFLCEICASFHPLFCNYSIVALSEL